jgi:hypothetical protein
VANRGLGNHMEGGEQVIDGNLIISYYRGFVWFERKK